MAFHHLNNLCVSCVKSFLDPGHSDEDMCLTLHRRHKLLKVTQRHLANQAAPGWNNAFLCGAEEALN